MRRRRRVCERGRGLRGVTLGSSLVMPALMACHLEGCRGVRAVPGVGLGEGGPVMGLPRGTVTFVRMLRPALGTGPLTLIVRWRTQEPTTADPGHARPLPGTIAAARSLVRPLPAPSRHVTHSAYKRVGTGEPNSVRLLAITHLAGERQKSDPSPLRRW
jgi:hypothetical protein